MIYFLENKKVAAVFGLGTIGMRTGLNDQMEYAPYLELNGWSEPQPIKEYDPNDPVTGEATPETIWLQFNDISGLDALERSLKRVRVMLESGLGGDDLKTDGADGYGANR